MRSSLFRRRGGVSAAVGMLFANNYGTPQGGARLIFSSVLQSTLVPALATGSSTPTFTRATAARVLDWEGLLKPVLSGEARFTGARRVENLTTSQNVSGWTLGSGVTVQAGIDDPLGGTSAYRVTGGAASYAFTTLTRAIVSSEQVRVSMWVRKSGTVTIFAMYDGGDGAHATTLTSVITSSWQRITPAVQTSAGGGNNTVGVQVGNGESVDICFVMAEVVTGQSNQNPSEYVSKGVLSAPYHGAGVDGVKYFTTKNGNTVASNVVTEATGAAITPANGGSTLTCDTGGPFGYLAEGARTNICLQSQTLGTTWATSNVTVGANEAAAPDGTTTADTLTASAGNGTLIQDLGSIASAVKTFSIWLKRKTGTGNIDLTLDGGSTWTTKTITASWARYEITQTLADPDCGIRIVTNGDAVWAWGGQVEAASFASSYIPTTTVSVTRNTDILTYVKSGNLDFAQGVGYAEVSITAQSSTNRAVLGATDAFSPYIGGASVTTVGAYDSVNNPSVSVAGSMVGTVRKVAAYWNSGGLNAAKDGTAGTKSAFDGSMGSGTAIQVGQYNGGSLPLFGTIRNFRVYSASYSDAQLAALTA